MKLAPEWQELDWTWEQVGTTMNFKAKLAEYKTKMETSGA